MRIKAATLHERLYLGAALTLLIGLGGSALIYLYAEPSSTNELVTDYENSKMYRHNLEMYGGQMNVLADEFRRWFGGLWHGKTLAWTVACITLVISLGLYFIASDPHHRKGNQEADGQS